METREAYRQILDAVSVTPEMERRVLSGLRAALETRQRPASGRRAPRLAAACAALALCAAAGLPLWMDSRPPALESPPVQVTWETQQFDSIEALADSLSYPLQLPAAVPEGYAPERIRCLQGQLAEVVWQAPDGRTLTYRMAPGESDISGDFTAYAQVEERTIGAYTVTCKGADGLVFLAVWSGGAYSFSIQSSAGLSTAETAALIQSITS